MQMDFQNQNTQHSTPPRMDEVDFKLLNDLHAAVSGERQLTLKVIDLLKKVDDRKLYLALGFGSLLEFCVQELKYSESAAYRRISAMRLVREMPELEEKIEMGRLSLAVVAQAATHMKCKEKLNQSKLAVAEKKEILLQVEGLSHREAEKVLLKDAPEVAQMKEKVRQVSEELLELKVLLTAEMQRDLEDLRSVLSHAMPNASIRDLLAVALKDSVKLRAKNRPGKSTGSSENSRTPTASAELIKSTPAPVAHDGESLVTKDQAALSKPRVIQKLNSSTRIQLPVAVKREVWRKSQGQCCYHHQGRRCSSRFQLEIDHVIPLAKGGTNAIENLRLLCRQHNAWKGF